ncbi:MAG: hypothetical protein JSV84_16250 [Gemmatimonadota bacterium]|nr:MAG: hypothetical protein JSV84_16250 [Gemmatimonadota bacterium]
MKRFLVVAAVSALCCVVGGVKSEDTQRKLVRIDLTGQKRETVQQFLNSQPDITSFDPEGNTVDVILELEHLQNVEALRLPVSVLIDDLHAYERDLRLKGYLDRFHTYAQMLGELERIAAEHPDIAKLFDIGDSWEKTQGIADRDIWAMKISDNVERQEVQEAEVLYMGCHHAREIITPEILLALMDYLVEHYGSDSSVTDLVDNRQLWFVPMVNPDGHSYVWTTNIWWRKNRKDNGDGTFGVDLNRNYGYMWGYNNVGSSSRSSSETYRGPAPFSEPETQAVRDFVEEHTFIASLSYHSYGNLFLFPWGYIPENTPDHDAFLAIGDSATVFNGYFAGNLAMGALYETNGDSDDWLYGEQTTKYKILAFTPEVGSRDDGFHPDTSRILPLIAENLWPNIFVARIAKNHMPRPLILHTPLDDTEDAGGPYTVIARITSPVYPLDTSSPRIYYNTTGVPPFESVAMYPTDSTDVFEGHIPGFGEEVHLYYYMAASDTVPLTGYAPPHAPDSLYTFYVGADIVAPVITHQPRVHRSASHASLCIDANVTDNLGVREVQLHYRINDGVGSSTVMDHHHSYFYRGCIDIEFPSVGDYVEYSIVATDSATHANTVRAPESGFYYVLLIESIEFDFEEDDGGFVTEGEGDWEWGRPITGPQSAHSGAKVWATNLSGPYRDLSDSRLVIPNIDLSDYVGATLTFYHWYQSESVSGVLLDGGNVKIAPDGEPYHVLTPVQGYDSSLVPIGNPLGGERAYGGTIGAGNFWHQEVFELSPYAHRVVFLRFHFGSNETVTGPGWYIDDVEIKLASSKIPAFRNTTAMDSTDNTRGPYEIFSSIMDDGDITEASLLFRTQGAPSFESLPMTEVVPYLLRGELPGQPLGTDVSYYIRAEDDAHNVVVDPPDAPDALYHFVVAHQCGTKGDVNGDESHDVRDVILTVAISLDASDHDPCDLWRADFNGDGTVDVLDVLSIVSVIIEGR